MGIDTMYHAIHAFGLAELMKSGTVLDVDDEHYWNLIDNTYVDDVSVFYNSDASVFTHERSTKPCWQADDPSMTTNSTYQQHSHHP